MAIKRWIALAELQRSENLAEEISRGPRSGSDFQCWSVSVEEQSATGNKDDITDSRTVLWPAEN